MLLALSGKMRSGKDTAADVLVKKHGFKKYSFAAPLKEICSEVFDINLNYFYNDDLKDAILPKPITATGEHCAKLCDIIEDRGINISQDRFQAVIDSLAGRSFTTPRALLQYIGTDVGRKNIDDNIWILLTKKAVQKEPNGVVIPDCRFQNEVDAVKEMGGYVGLVERPNMEIKSMTALHASETSLGGMNGFDIIFQNDGTLGTFQEQVELWYTFRKNA